MPPRTLPGIEAVAASSAAPGHVVDVSLVDREDPAGFGSIFAVHTAQMVSCQHRASDREMAACPALTAVALAGAQLPNHILLAEMYEE